jgi:hypothetical protein
MRPAWLPVYGVSDNEHRLSVLRPTTRHPVTGFGSITLVPKDVDAHVMQICSAWAGGPTSWRGRWRPRVVPTQPQMAIWADIGSSADIEVLSRCNLYPE